MSSFASRKKKKPKFKAGGVRTHDGDGVDVIGPSVPPSRTHKRRRRGLQAILYLPDACIKIDRIGTPKTKPAFFWKGKNINGACGSKKKGDTWRHAHKTDGVDVWVYLATNPSRVSNRIDERRFSLSKRHAGPRSEPVVVVCNNLFHLFSLLPSLISHTFFDSFLGTPPLLLLLSFAFVQHSIATVARHHSTVLSVKRMKENQYFNSYF